jgi:hypothetical protein
LITTMHVRRIVILGVHAKCDPIKPIRAHKSEYSEAGTITAPPLNCR